MTAIDDPAEILTVGRLADGLRECGLAWPQIVEELGEDSIAYVQHAHCTYEAHIAEQARVDQLKLF